MTQAREVRDWREGRHDDTIADAIDTILNTLARRTLDANDLVTEPTERSRVRYALLDQVELAKRRLYDTFGPNHADEPGTNRESDSEAK